MLFTMPEELSKDEQKKQLLRQQKCQACPLKKAKKADGHLTPVDVLIVSAPTDQLVGSGLMNAPTRHTFTVECPGDVNDAVKECCLGRKGELITRLTPKLVISCGPSLFHSMENLFGQDAPGLGLDGVLLPTEFNGHKFWHMGIPPYDVKLTLMGMTKTIERALQTTPEIMRCNMDGVQYIMGRSQMEAALKKLEGIPYLGWDKETTALRPYSGGQILTIALSSFQDTFAIPVCHPQTPSSVDQMLAFEMLMILARRGQRLVAHNLPFELEWSRHFLGEGFVWEGLFDDTQAQGYVLNGSAPKGLNDLVRREFGSNLKRLSIMSAAKVKNLKDQPLEHVLDYNAGDAKYTLPLFLAQQKRIRDHGIESVYEMQIERARAVVCMQGNGLVPNVEFIESESKKRRQRLQELRQEFSEIPEVKRYELTNGPANPLSDKDVKGLHEQMLKVISPSYDEAVLSSINHPISRTILKIRAENKIWGTYMVPFNPKEHHKNAGKYIHGDGLIHPIFNTMTAITARLSSDSPNAQNLPSGSQKWLRNVVKALEGYYILSNDYGQVEYRIIAAISQDPVMIDAILNGRDIHGFWAERIDQMFPGQFLKKIDKPCEKETNKACNCKKCEFKNFRGECKNKIVFPFCFGSTPGSVARAMGIEEEKMKAISQIFWEEHKGVKQWHKDLGRKYEKDHYVQNAFGRKYWAPLDPTQQINYPIQGTNGDLVNCKMARLARMAYEMKKPWLCPIVNEHDNLMFQIPLEIFQEESEIVLKVMLDTSEYPWLPVPLLLESEIGPTWGALQTLGSFSSEDWK